MLQQLTKYINLYLNIFSLTLPTPDGDILIDYSKNLINQDVFNMLIALAKSREVFEARDLMFQGAPINITENRYINNIRANFFIF